MGSKPILALVKFTLTVGPMLAFRAKVRRSTFWMMTLGAMSAVGVASSSSAQSAKASGIPFVGRTVLSLNPLGLPFKYVAAELEQKVTDIVTLGLAASYLGVNDASYSSLEAKLRLYPNEETFKGFSIGLAAGLSQLKEDVYNSSSSSSSSNSATRPTIAVLADYNWIIGRSKRVLVGTGLGAKRIFGSDSEFSDISFAYPTARFQIGLLF